VSWHVEGPLLDGWAVYHATVDPRDGTIFAAANSQLYGPTVHRYGGTTSARRECIGLPERSGVTVNAAWHVEPGRPEEPRTLYLGADPGVVFVSPETSYEHRYTSGGRLGVYRTRDAGASWEPMSDGLPERAWAGVLREAAAYDEESLYFGTQSGSLFALTEGEVETIGDAVRALPVADLLFNERGEWNRYLNLYVDGTDARDRGGLACPLAGVREVRIVGIPAGG
jgi:hypothetical protein